MRQLSMVEVALDPSASNLINVRHTQITVQAWMEISAIEWALSRHDCWKHGFLVHVNQGWSLS